jgi:hypothetical protein
MRKSFLVLLILFLCVAAFAADTVLTWPADGKDPVLRFTIGKLRQISAVSGQTDYLGEAMAENVGTKAIPAASFYVYLIDKNGKRVGEGYLEVTNLGAGQKAKVPVSVHAMGGYVKMELQAQHLPSDEPMKVKMSVSSVPAGASVKVNGQESGVTPQVIAMAPGKHTLEFTKEGYATASTPVEIAENAMPGSVNVELGPLSMDTVVLRDGTELVGNVTSVTTTGVSITVKGKASKFERAKVARVVFGLKAPGAVTTKVATKAKKK